jgi:DNA helicase-2/ATP-dependent DNA helicase PcrA
MTQPDHPLLAGLTEPQRAAVSHPPGALLVLAGPGSGKTTVVTRRIAWLIAQGAAPHQVLALTFTNKAAGEMRSRVVALLPGEVLAEGGPTVATFHSFCARQLRRCAAAAGLSPRFHIYDEADRREVLKQAILEAGLSAENFQPASVGSWISRAKNRLEDASSAATDFVGRGRAQIFRAYQRIMRANEALDFDDLLLVMAELLRRDEGVRRQFHERFRHLLVDEYQDTNRAQFAIAEALAEGHGSICVVGDPDQSIYRWRGADIGNILEFEEHFPGAAVIPLGRNFRSTGHIVSAAAGLIRHNKRRRHKDLSTELGAGERPQGIVCRDEQHEAALVADFLRRQQARGMPWKEMAVLYRINALSRVLEDALRQARVPYVIARGTAFYDRKEVKDALAYLRLVVNGSDEVALRRILNVPARGIGRTTLEKVEALARREKLRLLEALAAAGRGALEDLPARAAGALRRFVEMIEGFRRAAEHVPPATPLAALSRLVGDVVRGSGLEALFRTGTMEDVERLANLNELVNAAANLAVPAPPEDPSIAGWLGLFLESAALVSDADAVDPERGSVTLMTLHAAKGLEFDAVVLVGLEENLLPLLRFGEVESDLDLEEERRLCFVGMTRARRSLLLTRAMSRTQRGERRATIPSRFLAELPREAVELSIDEGFRPDDADVRGEDDRMLEAFPVGCIVRHPLYGLGSVEEVTRRSSGASARVRFPVAGLRTFILERTPLERVR